MDLEEDKQFGETASFIMSTLGTFEPIPIKLYMFKCRGRT